MTSVLWLVLSAGAADLDVVAGLWSLDPLASDDPTDLLYLGLRNPTASGQSASQYAPDGGASANQDAGERALATVKGLMFSSGRVSIEPAGDLLRIGFDGHEPMEVGLDEGWVRFKREDGDRLRIRATWTGDMLVVERKVKASTLVESFLAPKDPRRMYAVVRVSSSVVSPPIEFRRAYAALHPVADE